MRPLFLLPVMACLATATPALADSLNYNQISLRAEVRQSVNNDTLTVTLFTEDQDTDPAKLANRITTRLNKGLEVARKNTGIKVSSGNRSTQPVYDEKRENIIAWRERGEIRLEGTDYASLSGTMGELLRSGSGSMQFSLSADGRSATEDELIKRAIAAFRQQADIATESAAPTTDCPPQPQHPVHDAPPYMQSGRMMAMAADMEMATPRSRVAKPTSGRADGVIGCRCAGPLRAA